MLLNYVYIYCMLTNIFLVMAQSGVAQFTTYTSYASCCPDNENYDPNADTEECDKYSACDYSGEFEAIVRNILLIEIMLIASRGISLTSLFNHTI